jgi:hypothetical protein
MRSPAASEVRHYLNEPFLELLDTRNCSSRRNVPTKPLVEI